MKEGEIALTAIPQADGQRKIRPVLLLRKMPGRGDFLVCGISTQLQEQIKDFDQVVARRDPDFLQSGLTQDSLIRLGFLAIAPLHTVAGTIGSVSSKRHRELLLALSTHLQNARQ